MPSAIRTIITPIIPGAEKPVLAWAGRLGADFGASVDGAYVRQDAQLSMLLFGPGYAYASEALVEEVRKAERDAEKAARAAFEAAAETRIAGPFGRFVVVDETLDGNLARAARSYDLAVSLSAGEPASRPRLELLAKLALDAGVPVFVAPEACAPDRRLDRVLLAWDGSREAGRALRAAVPFLARAKQVRIVHLGAAHRDHDPVAAATAYLEAHGVSPAVTQFEPANLGEGGALLGLLEAGREDLLVMGAYGHPRWMEQAFGGATHDLVRQSPIPILLAH